MPLIFYVIILFLFLEILSFFYHKLFSQLVILRYSIILGIALHEFSHYLACKLTFTPVKRFHVGLKGGYVVHGKPRIPIIGGFLISFAPLFVGLTSLVGLIYFLNFRNLDLISFSLDRFSVITLSESIIIFKKSILMLNLKEWKFWLSLFLALNILATLTPSRKDYKNIFLGIITYGIISYFVTYFDKLNILLIYILALSAILLILAIFFLIILNLFKKIFRFL